MQIWNPQAMRKALHIWNVALMFGHFVLCRTVDSVRLLSVANVGIIVCRMWFQSCGYLSEHSAAAHTTNLHFLHLSTAGSHWLAGLSQVLLQQWLESHRCKHLNGSVQRISRVFCWTNKDFFEAAPLEKTCISWLYYNVVVRCSLPVNRGWLYHRTG